MATTKFGSKEEGWMYEALAYYKLPFAYQVPFNGGRMFRGGQVLDFVVYLPPKPIYIPMQGTYWHTGARGTDDAYANAQVERAGYIVKEVWDKQITSADAAKQWVRENIL